MSLPIHPDQLLSAVLMLVMFAIGATLRFTDFRKVFWRPKSLLIGLSLQLLFLPLFTFVVLCFTNIDPLFKVGFIILSLCPGGTTSNFISYLVNADVALSISLTTINSFIILISIPLGTNMALDYYLQTQTEITLPFGDTIFQVFFLILVPAFLGVLFNRVFPDLSMRVRMPLKIINALLLFSVFILKYFSDVESGGAGITTEELSELLPVGIVLQISTMILAYVLATYFVQRKTSCLTIGIEVGLQNTTLALFIASVILSSNAMSKPALVYAIFSFITTLLFSYLIYRFVILANRVKYRKLH